MTAFELLLNRYYEIIEENEPTKRDESHPGLTFELNKMVRDFVKISFNSGHDLSQKSLIDRLFEESAILFQNANYDEWARVKTVFQQNGLHLIRRDRKMKDMEKLKVRLERML